VSSRALAPHRGWAQTVARIYADGGVRAFFRGATARFAVNAPSAAISWGTYEAAKHALLSLSADGPSS
jgi:hypothetical protein